MIVGNLLCVNFVSVGSVTILFVFVGKVMSHS